MARPMTRLIQEQIKRPMADALLFGELGGRGGVVRVRLERAADGDASTAAGAATAASGAPTTGAGAPTAGPRAAKDRLLLEFVLA